MCGYFQCLTTGILPSNCLNWHLGLVWLHFFFFLIPKLHFHMSLTNGWLDLVLNSATPILILTVLIHSLLSLDQLYLHVLHSHRWPIWQPLQLRQWVLCGFHAASTRGRPTKPPTPHPNPVLFPGELPDPVIHRKLQPHGSNISWKHSSCQHPWEIPFLR